MMEKVARDPDARPAPSGAAIEEAAALGQTLSETGRYLRHRGLVAATDAGWILRILSKTYEAISGPRVDLTMMPLPGVQLLKTRLEFDRNRQSIKVFPFWRFGGIRLAEAELSARNLRTMAIAISAMVAVGSFVPLLLFVTPLRLIAAAMAALFRSVRLAVSSMPALLAILVFLFVTRDAWSLFGRESNKRFAVLIGVFIAISVTSVLSRLRDRGGAWETLVGIATAGGGPSMRQRARRTPAAALVASGIKPIVDRPTWPVRWNLTVLSSLAMIVRLFAIALWVAIAFAVVGLLAIDESTTGRLADEQVATVILRLFDHRIVVTRELLLVSATLGGIAALYFATVALAERKNRAAFLRLALDPVAELASVFSFYRSASARVPEGFDVLIAAIEKRLAQYADLRRRTDSGDP